MFDAVSRHLRQSEITLAKRVFGGTLPYDKILLCNNTGANNRPFTNSDPFGDGYYLHVGPKIYADATLTSAYDFYKDGSVHSRYCDVFIHELTHVWQSKYRTGGYAGVVVSSLVNQVLPGDAYSYTEGKKWSEYNVEQQARIVEDWFNAGIGKESTTDSRYKYILGNILAKNSG